ncbi:alpha/beta hydrolase fold domain-containing protein [Cryptosporangium aurantiacum]|uniref:Alpha/beta hydrolase fold n=1 Tax=Cryptosporangium aurantiacum TaxID=134849 RepID=A0A1M7QTH7_9ACTN|nr:alpha/beta hydrolase fold domain-containing protein [Cryptosporangium aurantiacum]SHN35038.1 alpha/beta hydrolase fold [Cryptosporangium aurantiacum]
MTTDLNRLLWQERAAGDSTRPWESLTTEPDGIRAEAVRLPSGPGLWLRPPGGTDDQVLLAIHGGGFVSGSIATHRRMFGHLALASGMTTLVVEYGLVPEHVYPAQLDQVSSAYRTLTGRQVAVVGDSCGGTLALGIALRARPAALVLFSPWVDFSAGGASYDAGTDPFFTRELTRGLATAYLAGAYLAEADREATDLAGADRAGADREATDLAGADRAGADRAGADRVGAFSNGANLTAADPSGAARGEPAADLARADLDRLPPTYVQVGGDEALLDDARLLARRAPAVELEVFPGQLHTFQMAAGRSPVADDAIGKAGSWLRRTLG